MNDATYIDLITSTTNTTNTTNAVNTTNTTNAVNTMNTTNAVSTTRELSGLLLEKVIKWLAAARHAYFVSADNLIQERVLYLL